MKADYSERAGKTLQGLPPDVRKAVFKQVRFLEQNLRHPVAPRQEVRREPGPLAGPSQQRLALLFPNPG